MFEIFQHLNPLTWATFIVTAAIAVGLIIHYILFFAFGTLSTQAWEQLAQQDAADAKATVRNVAEKAADVEATFELRAGGGS